MASTALQDLSRGLFGYSKSARAIARRNHTGSGLSHPKRQRVFRQEKPRFDPLEPGHFVFPLRGLWDLRVSLVSPEPGMARAKLPSMSSA